MSKQAWPIDTPPSERFPVYTRMNANDVLPDPITPLGATMAWIPHIFPGWAAGYVSMGAFTGDELFPDPTSVAGFFYGYLYVNQSNVRVVGIRAGIGWEAIDSAFFSADSPPHDPDPRDVNPEASEKVGRTTAWAMTATAFPDLDEERALADRVRTNRPDFATMSPAALVNWARSLMPLERFMWRAYVQGSNQSSLGPAIIGQVVGTVDPSLVIRVIGHAGDVDSAAPTYALWDLSRAVRADASLSAAFDQGADGLLDRIHSDHPEFAARFALFLRDFGYRGPSEWDLGSDAWETNPGLVLALLDRLRQLDDTGSPAARQARQAEETQLAVQQALQIVGDNPEARQMLETGIAVARRFAAWRERGKTNAIKVLHEARMPLFELGRRLHDEGKLAHPRQIFMALEEELDTLVLNPDRLTDTLAERERQWRDLFDVELPTFVDSRKPIPKLSELPRKAADGVAPAQAGDVLQGQPASGGMARGVARVLLDTASIADFQPGEILVAPQTDPSWTPLFVVAAGVVVDVGAMGSHAMIVSRELGIPCAAGVKDATRRIRTGATVEVDGATGTVTVVAEP